MFVRNPVSFICGLSQNYFEVPQVKTSVVKSYLMKHGRTANRNPSLKLPRNFKLLHLRDHFKPHYISWFFIRVIRTSYVPSHPK